MVEQNATNEKMVSLSSVASQMRMLASAMVERFTMARALGMTHGGKRNTYEVFGYDDTITAQQYRDRYERGGLAKRIVDAYPMAVWRGEGELAENDDLENRTVFEQQWYELNDQLRVWSTLKRAHVLANLANFSAILIGAPGDLATPLPVGQPGGILYLRVLSGGVTTGSASNGGRPTVTTPAAESIVVKEYDENVRSRRFGLPLTYQLKMPGFTDEQLQKPVHYTRVHHIPAPGFLDNDLFGPPFLEAVWNDLINLDKVSGGGSEAFWMRANAGLHVDVDKKTTLSATKEEKEAELNALREQAEAYAHQMTRMMRTRGVNINQLGSDVADFSGPQKSILQLIAGTTGIPMRILVGSEMGSLASEQDQENWNSQVKDVRSDYAHPVVLRPFVERLISYGYLAKPKEWKPRWPDEGAMSEVDKIKAAKDLKELNTNKSGIVVTQNEIREFIGKEPFTDAQLQEFAEQKADEAAAAMERAQVNKLEAALASNNKLELVVTR